MTTRSGQSIIETVIAAALISIGILAALSLSTRSERQNNYAKNLAEASKYTSQAADYLRSQRSTIGWATIATKATAEDVNNFVTYCLNTLPDANSSFSDLTTGECSDNTFIPDDSSDGNSPFTRTVLVDTSRVGEGILKFTITVSWTDQSPRSTSLEMELSSWQ